MNNATFTVLDTETCDLKGGIIELGFVVLDSFEELMTLPKPDLISRTNVQHFKNPWPIAAEATAVHGKTADMLKDFPLFDLQEHFLSHLKTRLEDNFDTNIIVGYNSKAFDIKKLGLDDSTIDIDIYRLVQLMKKEKVLDVEKLKLDSLSVIFCPNDQLAHGEYHGTVVDNIKTIFLLRSLKEHFFTDELDYKKLLIMTSSAVPAVLKKQTLTSILK